MYFIEVSQAEIASSSVTQSVPNVIVHVASIVVGGQDDTSVVSLVGGKLRVAQPYSEFEARLDLID